MENLTIESFKFLINVTNHETNRIWWTRSSSIHQMLVNSFIEAKSSTPWTLVNSFCLTFMLWLHKYTWTSFCLVFGNRQPVCSCNRSQIDTHEEEMRDRILVCFYMRDRTKKQRRSNYQSHNKDKVIPW